MLTDALELEILERCAEEITVEEMVVRIAAELGVHGREDVGSVAVLGEERKGGEGSDEAEVEKEMRGCKGEDKGEGGGESRRTHHGDRRAVW